MAFSTGMVRKPAPLPIGPAAKKQFGAQVRRVAQKRYGPNWQDKAFGKNTNVSTTYAAQRAARVGGGAAPRTPQLQQANKRFQRFGNKLLASNSRDKILKRKPPVQAVTKQLAAGGGMGRSY